MPDEDPLTTLARLGQGDEERGLTLKHRSLATDRSSLMDRADHALDDMPFASREDAEAFASSIRLFDDEPQA